MNSSNQSPIVLFVYNRPWHTEQTLNALKANFGANGSELIIYSDGARSERDAPDVARVRELIRKTTGFRSTTIIERERNWGLANSIISGVTEVVERYGTLIVLEDDLVTSSYFLQYMNDALQKYRDNPRVVCVHGYTYPIKARLPETYFLRGADCWGWATWKRGWELFQEDGKKLLEELNKRGLLREFDLEDTYPYSQMLRDQIAGRNNSWAIRWHASCFLANGLTLYPTHSLVKNIGVDGSGTHCSNSSSYHSELATKRVRIADQNVEVSLVAVAAVKRYFQSLSMERLKLPLWKRVLDLCLFR
jgi:hypothetical protein